MVVEGVHDDDGMPANEGGFAMEFVGEEDGAHGLFGFPFIRASA